MARVKDVLVVLCWAFWCTFAIAYTDPDELERLLVLRDALRKRGPAWVKAVETWTCPGEEDHDETRIVDYGGDRFQTSQNEEEEDTQVVEEEQEDTQVVEEEQEDTQVVEEEQEDTQAEEQEEAETQVEEESTGDGLGLGLFRGWFGSGRRRLQGENLCDPCGEDNQGWGNWKHVGCRGGPGGEYTGDRSFYGIDAPAGYVTNIHITDQSTITPGGLNTEVPPEFCLLTKLRELDLDGGNLIGEIPSWIPSCFKYLRELDLSFNFLTGEIPNWFTEMRGLQEYKIEANNMTGRVPEGFASLENIRIIRLEENDFYGPLPQDFEFLSTIQVLWLFDNPRLCGPVKVPEIELVCCFCEVAECGIFTQNTSLDQPCTQPWPRLDNAPMDPVEPLLPCAVPTKSGDLIPAELPPSACGVLLRVYE